MKARIIAVLAFLAGCSSSTSTSAPPHVEHPPQECSAGYPCPNDPAPSDPDTCTERLYASCTEVSKDYLACIHAKACGDDGRASPTLADASCSSLAMAEAQCLKTGSF